MTPKPHLPTVSSIVLALVAVLLAAAPADAQALAMAPAEVRATFKPGEPVRFDVTVSNEGTTPVVMHASVMDFWYNDKNEKIFGTPGSQPRSASDWIEFVPRDFTVPAQGSGKLNVVITPPADAKGGYYAVLFVESKPTLVQAATAETRAIYANMRLGALVLLSAAGTQTLGIQTDDFRLTPPAGDQPLTLQFQLANQSNTHIFPQAKLAILNQVGRQVVARTETQPKRFLPDQKDTLAMTWNGTLPPGDYLAILTMTYGDDKVFTREFPFTVAPATRTAVISRVP
jgi:hypothetical protein